MVTLSNVLGGSLAVRTGSAVAPSLIREADAFSSALASVGGQIGANLEKERDIKRVADLAEGITTGITPQDSGGFLRKIAPGLADIIGGLNQSREPDQIDQVRSEAQISGTTAGRVLAAETQAEKQKIFLESAERLRQEGRDTSELLRVSGLSSAEMDLNAQKAQMTANATLQELPEPTAQERAVTQARLRAELGAIAPNVLRGIERQEALARAEQQRRTAVGRKAAATAQTAAAAQLIVDLDAQITGDAQAPDPTAAPTAAPTVGDELTGGGGVAELSGGSVGEDRLLTPAPVISPEATAATPPEQQSRIIDFTNTFREESAFAAKARELANSPNPDVRKAAGVLVKAHEAAASAAKESLEFEQELIESEQDATAGSETEKDVVQYANGTSVQFFADGSRRVLGADGQLVTNPAAQAAAIAEGTQSDIDKAGFTAGQQAAAKASIAAGTAAFEQLAPVNKSILNMQEALRLSEAGSPSGPIMNLLPDVSAGAVALSNVANRMTLDVVSAVTFGALSEGELRLAQDTALPRGLAPAELQVWLKDRINAQTKLRAYLTQAAREMSDPKLGGITGFIDRQEAQAAKREQIQADRPTPPNVKVEDWARMKWQDRELF